MNKIDGVVIGTVKSLKDPKNLGRIKVHFPWLSDANKSHWARVATLMAGSGRGSWFMPEKDDEVLVAFEHGDTRFPYIVGFLWNGQDKPPRIDPQKRLIRSVNGHEIEIYDPDIKGGDRGYIRLKDAQGNQIELANGSISISSVGGITINAPNVVINGRPVAPSPSPI
jgi:uncharacterized protein involved in type VI secretion and phage assembly